MTDNGKTFLALTGDQNFWDSKLPILYLGRWCLSYEMEKENPEILKQVCDYHWDDRKKFYLDSLYLGDLQERILIHLIPRLNKIHNRNHSERFYKILFKAWLIHFLPAVFDRYSCLKTCSQNGEKLFTHVIDLNYVPPSLNQFLMDSNTDSYNHYLFSEVLKYSQIAIDSLEVKLDSKYLDLSQDNDLQALLSGQGGFKSLLKNLSSRIASRLNSLVVSRNNSNLSKANYTKLHLKLGQIPVAYPEIHGLGKALDLSLRKELCEGFQAKSEFEEMFLKLLEHHLPVYTLESFQDLEKQALETYPKNVRLIYSGNGLADDGFRFFCAHAMEQGAKIVTMQHGGFVDTAKFSAYGEYEYEYGDYHLSWGWNDPSHSVIPFYINKVIDPVSPSKQGDILVCFYSVYRFANRMDSWVQSSQMLLTLDRLIEMVECLKPEVQKLVKLRFHRNFGWDEQLRFEDRCPQIRTENINSGSLFSSMKNARLVVGTYNTTILLECLAMNFPIVVFWSPDLDEISEKAKPRYRMLEDAKILFSDPQQFASHLAEVHENVESWWEGEKVQETKKRFLEQSMHVSEDYIQDFLTLTGKLLKETV